MNSEFLNALDEIEKGKNISKDILLNAIDAALVSAYKRNYNTNHSNVVVNIDRESGEIKVFKQKEVVEVVEDDFTQISVDEAKSISGTYELGDMVNIEEKPADFGRIAAQTAKQVVMQRIKEAERTLIYDEFSEKEHKIVTGVVQRIEKKNIYLDIGKTEAYLAPGEQVPTEDYSFHKRMKVYVTEVKNLTKGPLVTVSRTRPGLVLKLFEEEIPEIHDGIVEIKSISREAGSRTKIAVCSSDPNIDPIGSCIGPKCIRKNNITNEIKGEKIDIIKFSEDAEEFIRAALSPAQVVSVKETGDRSCYVLVEDDQLSLAIGKEGQNARLAARLTGFKIDIKTDL